MIKKNAKWIVLAVIAIPVVGFTVYPLLAPAVMVTESVVVSESDHQNSPSVFTPPTDVERVMVTFDGNSTAIIAKTTDLRLKELDTLLAEQDLKTFEVKNKKSDSVTRDEEFALLGLGAQIIAPLPQGSAKPAVPVMNINPLNQLQLNSLITVDGKTIAYLSVDGLPPVRVQKGSKIGGALVSSVSKNSVTVTSGKLRRVLTGIDYE
jgi:hypothetical protein